MSGRELKAEFLQSLLDRTRLWSYVERASAALKRLRRAEAIMGKDAFACTEEEAGQMFGLFRKSTRYTVLFFARKYVIWCMENRITGTARGFLDFRPDELDNARAEMVANPIGLQTVLNEVYAPESDRTLSNIYRCLAWCAFSGVPYEDAVCLTADNIDFDSGLIRTDGGEYVLYVESVPAFKIACDSAWFYSDHPNHDHVIRERTGGSLILRGITADALDQNPGLTGRFAGDFRNARRKGITKSKIKYETLLKSGFFYRVSELETENQPEDLDNYLQRRIDDKFEKDGQGYRLYGKDITEKMTGVVENNIYEEYYRWKIAFLPV